MPLGDGVWIYDDQSARPPRPRGAQSDPASAIDIIEHWPWPLLFQRGNLLPQRQIFDQEFLASAKDGSERMDAELHQED